MLRTVVRLRPLVLALGLCSIPSIAVSQAALGMEAVAFMVGCWAESPEPGLKEYYGPPADNMMTGLSQFWRGPRIVDWEFHRIDLGPDGPTLTPHPRGVASVTFGPVAMGEDRIAWENLDHDFPNRISYRRVAPDSMVVTVEGGEGEDARSVTWRLIRARCETP